MADHIKEVPPPENKVVVDLGEYKERRPQTVWQCRCGCQLFYIREEGSGAECRDCGRVHWFAFNDDREDDYDE